MEVKFRLVEDVTVIDVVGKLDFETATSFRKLNLLNLSSQKVVFNLEKLQFVGSCGIGMFLDAVTDFIQTKNLEPQFCAMVSEYKKLLLARSFSDKKFHDNELAAIQSFSLKLEEEAKPNSISDIIS